MTKLIESKETQGANYEKLWLVVISRTPIIDAGDLAARLDRRRNELPANWRRVFFLERANVTQVFNS